MIAGFEEADLVALFLDFPAYVGDPQAGEMIFNRKYEHGLELLFF